MEQTAPLTKKCKGPCSQVRPLSDFHRDRNQSDGRVPWCKACTQERVQRQRTPARNRKYNLKKCYGITPDDYARLLAAQGGVCAICGSPSPGPKETNFHVDHDHATGHLRGLLCECCNLGIGYFDSPDHLDKAAAYLRHKECPLDC